MARGGVWEALWRPGTVGRGQSGGGAWCRRDSSEDRVGKGGGNLRGGHSVLMTELEGKRRNGYEEFYLGLIGEEAQGGGDSRIWPALGKNASGREVVGVLMMQMAQSWLAFIAGEGQCEQWRVEVRVARGRRRGRPSANSAGEGKSRGEVVVRGGSEGGRRQGG